MRRASLGTLFLTVFLDLLGFGLVVPFLPGVARELGASNIVATLLGAAYSLMQFVLIPIWGRLSDRVGRRPVLLWSIFATAIGMALLGFANSLFMLFVARIFTGMATANIAVAQAYVADVTTPETRARGMGMIGMGFGLGFIFGPFLGGVLGGVELFGREGALASFVAAGLSLVNLVLAFLFVPESLPLEKRGTTRKAIPIDPAAFAAAARLPGIGLALIVSFFVTFWFAGFEQTLRLYTEDGFNMTVVDTGHLFAFVGVVAVVVQGGLIHRLTRRYGEARLLLAGTIFLGLGFAIMGVSSLLASFPRGVLLLGLSILALGTGLTTPSASSYISRRAGAAGQGTTLGVLQSIGALARVLGPIAGGVLYQFGGIQAPYFAGAVGMAAVALVAGHLPVSASPPVTEATAAPLARSPDKAAPARR